MISGELEIEVERALKVPYFPGTGSSLRCSVPGFGIADDLVNREGFSGSPAICGSEKFIAN